MNKLKLMEKLILENATLSPYSGERGIYSKWDDQVNWMQGYPKEFQKYIRKLFKEEDKK